MTTADLLDKHGYAYLKNVLTHDQCDELSTAMLLAKKEDKLVYNNHDKKNIYASESYHGDLPILEDTLRQVTPRISDELNRKLKIANSFARIYYSSAKLIPHVDRSGLDYTLSITLYNNLNFEWPLWCIDRLGNTVPLHIDRGDGGMMFGTEIRHWRDELICDSDKYVIQMFMHWSFTN